MLFNAFRAVLSFFQPKPKVKKPCKPTVVIFLGSFVKTAARDVGESTSANYHTAVRSFQRFNKKKDIALSEITKRKIAQYVLWLKDNGVGNNTISCYLRSLRAIYNKGVAWYDVCNKHPFRDVFMGNEQTTKTSLNSEDIKRLYGLELPEGSFVEFARDLFLFSFCAMGMPPIDLFHLRYSQVKGNEIVYRRCKTGNKVVVPINEQMRKLMDKYREEGSDHIFPRLGGSRKYRSFLSQYNRALKLLAAKANMECSLSSYTPRHSWASIANEKGVPVGIISQALGHSNISTTQHYLDKIDSGTMKKMNDFVLEDIFVAPIAKRYNKMRQVPAKVRLFFQTSKCFLTNFPSPSLSVLCTIP